jgi:hypothetical protein
MVGNTYIDEPEQVLLFRQTQEATDLVASSPARSHEVIASRLRTLR